jgi:aminoglycoside phosphotransferase (APT) family kinase protein
MLNGDISQLESITTEVRPGMGFDVDTLEKYLQAGIADFSGPLQVRQFKGGQSNPTYLLMTPSRNYVLRRKPPGELLSSAHAVDREYRVICALGTHTRVPVARAYLMCTDNSIIGTWFYVMEHVRGRIFWDPTLPEVKREDRPLYYRAMVETLAALHRVNPSDVTLSDYGKSTDYLPRQIARWSKQYHADAVAGRIPAMDRLLEWLPVHMPKGDQPPAIVHGDYRTDNLVFHPERPQVSAILDWELSTIGDPLADFAYHLMAYRTPKLFVPGLLGKDLEALNIPSEAQYVQMYCAGTGRERLENLDFYVAFCMFRLAAILHGIRGRVARGTAASAQAKEYAQHVEAVAELGWQQAERAMGAGTGENR